MAPIQNTAAPAAPTTADPAAHLTARLVRVRPGTAYVLHFIDRVVEWTGKTDERGKRIMHTTFDFGEDTYRGGPGYVVDWTEPLERVWCRGQEHKLENVPEAELATTVANPHTNPIALRALQKPAREAEKQALADKQAEHDAQRKKPRANDPMPTTFLTPQKRSEG